MAKRVVGLHRGGGEEEGTRDAWDGADVPKSQLK